jgi:hypothetical protein
LADRQISPTLLAFLQSTQARINRVLAKLLFDAQELVVFGQITIDNLIP